MTHRALVLTGSGRYADPWHPFAEVGAEVADILRHRGWDVAVSDDVDQGMANLDGYDLVAVCAGDPWREGTRGAPPAAVAGFAAALERGIGVLAMHSAVSSLRDYPEWASALGAIWLPELSYHPEAGEMTVQVEPDAVPAEVPVTFHTHDERYCALQRLGHRTVVAWHEGDGAKEAAAWVREFGGGRIAVDVLGHDARALETSGHRSLIAALAAWAVASS
ncbi:ThuA domain-containing protein [Microbacterium imperiale]|uniref:ThuA-like domain-containing protein n=1 Tax=Microbacterium imperiale TaxID=33884 RepID=A0A9W6HHF7_9MICO|nr:ThuA domain-containing protein [Microbacterium imperiale]MBP2421281.1 type 1 glutamine amidotransferase [Microbacterium imperiale]MDS0199609.1 ThuA domain-containing protein [Microbacterium imperiale]BFE41620.1 hypothetical protein GCM10017544_25760 [Microbacterium imperiale]GLJ80571.1 hypothetical protein GCM10017586_22540 [Microbacterium imperiale]